MYFLKVLFTIEIKIATQCLFRVLLKLGEFSFSLIISLCAFDYCMKLTQCLFRLLLKLGIQIQKSITLFTKSRVNVSILIRQV